jgi:DNA-binding GntR family transcriptional regulator
MTHNRESDRVEAELRRLILSLELEPGAALSEAELMKRFGWGRTPLREAFQRLTEQSLLQYTPRQGVQVTPLSVFDFAAVMDAMAMVIGPSASLACRRLSEAQLDELSALVEKLHGAETQHDFITLSELDYQFHALLAEASGNPYLRDYLLHLHRVATRFNLAAWQRDGIASASLSEHRRILEALQARDAAAVREAMLAHIENARQRIVGGMHGGE